MVELAVHQKPLHQVDVSLAGSAGAAERAAPDLCHRRYSCVRGLAWLVQMTQDVVRKGEDGAETSGGGGGRWRVMWEGGRSNTESGSEDVYRSFC